MSSREEFLQDLIIENIPIQEEVSKHHTRRAMSIPETIQANSVLDEPSMVATNKSYFSKLTGRNDANILADKVIVTKNLQETSGTHQHGTHFSGAT